MRLRRPFSLRRWPVEAYLLLIGLAVAVPLVSALALTALRNYSSDRARAEDSIETMAATAAANTARFISGAQASLAVLAERPLVRAADPARCDPFLADFLASNPSYLNVAVTNATGEIVCSGTALPPGPLPTAAGLAWWERGMAGGQPFVSEPHQGPVTGKLVAVIGHPFSGPGGAPAGLVGVSIELERFQQRLDGFALPGGGTVTILDGTGTVVARSVDPQAWVGKSVRDSGIAEATLSSPGGIIEAHGADGVERVYAYTVVPGTDWRAYVGLTTEYVYGDADMALQRSAIVVAATALAALLLGWAASRRLKRPMSALAAAAPGAVAGEPGARAPVAGPAELAAIGAGLNVLAGLREEALERAATLGAIVEAADAAVFAATLDGAITTWNRGAERLLGYTAEEMAGRNMLELVPPRLREGAAGMVAQEARGEHVSIDTGVVLTRDGREIPVAVSTFVVRDASGVRTGVGAILRDISAHVAAEREIARLGAIVEATDDAVISRTTDGHIVTWNAAAERMFGYTAAEATGQDIHFLIPEDRYAETEEIIARTAQGEVVHGETVRVAKDGRRIDVAVTLSPVHGRGGEITIAAIVRDISEQKRLERERAEAANAALRLADIARSSTDMVLCFDREGVITYVNPAFEAALGFSENAGPLGRKAMSLVPADQAERIFGLMTLALTGRSFAIETEAVAAGGRQIPLSSAVFPTYDERGELTGVAVVSRNLTEQRRLERERAEAARVASQLAAIVESSDDVIVSYDLEGHILTWNKAAERLTGWTAEEMVGRDVERVAPPEQREEISEFMAHVRAGETVHVERERMARDGSRIPFAIVAFPVRGARGEPVAMAAIARDLTEEKRMEQERAEAAGVAAQLAAIVESSDDAIMSRDLEGRILSWNAAAERLFGWTAEEMLG